MMPLPAPQVKSFAAAQSAERGTRPPSPVAVTYSV
jgi:hypothetical protein